MVGDGVSTHKKDYVEILRDFNLEGHQNRTTGSRVIATLLKGGILPIGGVAGLLLRLSLTLMNTYFHISKPFGSDNKKIYPF